VFLGIVALLAAAAAAFFCGPVPKKGGTAFDRFKFRLPVIGDTLLKFQVAQFSRTLSTLLTGGTPLVAGLQTASDAITSKLLRSTVNQATKWFAKVNLCTVRWLPRVSCRRWRWI